MKFDVFLCIFGKRVCELVCFENIRYVFSYFVHELSDRLALLVYIIHLSFIHIHSRLVVSCSLHASVPLVIYLNNFQHNIDTYQSLIVSSNVWSSGSSSFAVTRVIIADSCILVALDTGYGAGHSSIRS